MVRALRADEAGGIYHALNRGTAKNPIFFKDADCEVFELAMSIKADSRAFRCKTMPPFMSSAAMLSEVL